MTARSAAARELAEETGIQIVPDRLQLAHVKTGGDHGDLGIFFTAPLEMTLVQAGQLFTSFVAGQPAAEFSELVAFTLGPPPTQPSRRPFMVDYMEDVLRAALGLAGAIFYEPERSCSYAVRQVPVWCA